MKKYKVTVNGTAYEITLEAIDAADVKSSPAAPAPAAEADPAPAGAPENPEPGSDSAWHTRRCSRRPQRQLCRSKSFPYKKNQALEDEHVHQRNLERSNSFAIQ